MKHVRESLSQFNDYKFFKIFEEEEKAELQDKEKDGLAVIDKITKNFEDFKKDAKGEILKFKEFWEENQKTKEGFTESGSIYKLFDSDYVVGVLELPAETLSDGSIDGGMGATDEPEEEIIEGPEIEPEDEQPKKDFFEEQQVPNPTNEAEEEEEDLGLDLNFDEEPGTEETPEAPTQEPTAPEEPSTAPEETPEAPTQEPEMAPEAPVEKPAADLTAPQTYLVVYDLAGNEREEIFRCGSNNVVNAFNAFYNDIFKGSMKDAILQFKEQKEIEKTEAEKAEKDKVASDKQSKIKKFLGNTKSEKPAEKKEEKPTEKPTEKSEEKPNEIVKESLA